MRSVAVVDPPISVSPRHATDELLVLWQHPQTREIVPIGRFSRQDGQYAFVYTRAAAEIEGFRPLPGLKDLRQVYKSEMIPSVFNQRVMSSDRPDFGQYVASLGLTTEATPWEQIVGSGGRRAGDTLQFMPMPSVVEGHAHARFLANGLRHIPEEPLQLPGRIVHVTHEQHEHALCDLNVDDPLLLEPEDENTEDRFAIVLTSRGTPVGWVPRALSSGLRESVEASSRFARVHRVGEPGSPHHVRLVLDLDIRVPEGFTFDPTRRWEPLSA